MISLYRASTLLSASNRNNKVIEVIASANFTASQHARGMSWELIRLGRRDKSASLRRSSVNDNVIYVYLQGSTGGSLSPVTSLTLNSLTGTPLNGLQDSLSNAYSNLQQYAGNYPTRRVTFVLLAIAEIQTENVTLYPREHTKVPSFLTSELCALKLSLERRRWPWKRKSCIVSNNEFSYCLDMYIPMNRPCLIELFMWLTFRSMNFSSVLFR